MSYENDILIRARARGSRHKEKPRVDGLRAVRPDPGWGWGVLPWTQALLTQGEAVGLRSLQFPEQSQPLAAWIQQTLSGCHGEGNSKPRGSPDQRQRLRLPGAGALRACPGAYKTPSLGTSRGLPAFRP